MTFHGWATFFRGLRTMRPFVGRRVPRPVTEEHPEGYWVEYDESNHGIGFTYRSQPGSHFRFMYISIGNRKIGTYDLDG